MSDPRTAEQKQEGWLPFTIEHPDEWEINQAGHAVMIEQRPLEIIFTKGSPTIVIYEGQPYYMGGKPVPRDKVPSQIIDRLDPPPSDEELMKEHYPPDGFEGDQPSEDEVPPFDLDEFEKPREEGEKKDAEI